MPMQRTLSIRWRLTLGFFALLLLFAVNLGIYQYADGERDEAFEQLQNAQKSQLLVEEMSSSLARRRTVVRTFRTLATVGESIGPDELTRLNAGVQAFGEKALELERLASEETGGTQRELKDVTLRLTRAWYDYFASLAEVDPASPPAGTGDDEPASDPAADPAAPDSGDPATDLASQLEPLPESMQEKYSLIEDLSRDASKWLELLASSEAIRVGEAYGTFEDVRSRTNQTTRAIFAITILIAIAIAIAVAGYLTRNLRALETGARRIGEGDLDHRIELRAGDEIGRLAAAFNHMAGKLRESLAKEEEARLAAESANRAKSTFLANMSHELRTPMNAILGYSEMLAEEAEDEELETFSRDLGKIIAAGKHLLALINDVLDLSKIEAGKTTLFIEEIWIDELLEDVAATVEPLMTKNQNRFQIEALGELGTFWADETKVRQALFNLLSNAAKFTETGSVSLTAERREETIRFQVVDSGIGMSDTQLSRVFDEFTQADASTTRKFGGTGLGLSISRKFCRLMGGDLWADSEQGSGSIFTMELPIRVVVPPDPDQVESDVADEPVAQDGADPPPSAR